MNTNMQKLFDSLRDGVAIVTPDARVRYVNGIAARHLGLAAGQALAAESLRHHIDAALRGYVKLPLTLEVDAPGQARAIDRLRVSLLQSPVGEDYVLVVHNVTEAQFYENTVRNLAEILNADLGAPLMALAGDLEQLRERAARVSAGDDPVPLGDLTDGIVEKGNGLLRRLNQLLLLAETFVHAPMLDQERIAPAELISEALMLVKPVLAARRIRVSLSGVNDGLPSLYGSRQWLARVLAEYIQHLAAHAKNDAELLLTAKGGGNFILFRLQNWGLGIPAHLRERAFLPFHRGAEPGEDNGLGLGLALCRRVVELHRGHLHLKESDGEIVELSLELPAGGLPQARDADGIEQAQRYALDLARLMRRSAPAAN